MSSRDPQTKTGQRKYLKAWDRTRVNKILKTPDRLGPARPGTCWFMDPRYHQNILKLEILTRTKKLEIRRFIIIEIM